MSVQGFEFYFEEPKELQLQFDHQYQPLFEFDEIDSKKIYEDPEFSCNFKFNFDINKFNGNFKLFENEMNLITFEEKEKDEFEYQFDHHQELWECREQQKSNSVKFEEENDLEYFQHSSNNLNLNPTVLSGSESNLIYNKSGSIRKKIGRKPVFTGLQQRKDVVLKSLLRKIHSFYWKDINHETNYIKQKKKRGVQYFEEYLKSIFKISYNKNLN